MTGRIPNHFDTVLKRGASGHEVRQLQELLNLAGSRPRLPGTGFFGEMTDKSVRSFQADHGLGVDGKVGPKTFETLARVVRQKQANPSAPVRNGSDATSDQSSGQGSGGEVASAPNGDFCFPLDHRPVTWKTNGRQFGAFRTKTRLHAGNDLLAPPGTPIYAIADGLVLRVGSGFRDSTGVVEVRHGSFIARYGEIREGSFVGGKHVRKGQMICRVGRLDSGSSMLHFELYTNGANTRDPLTIMHRGQYWRRSDLTNPSPYLDRWIENLPRP